MKKYVLGLAVFVAVAFGIITVLRLRESDSSHDGSALADAEKQRIQTFWDSYNKANELRAQGEFDAAVPAYRACLKLDPEHEESLYYLGTSLQEVGEYTEAAATFRNMIELYPESSRAHSQLGNTLSTLAPGARLDFDRARRAYLRSVEINREEAGPFLRLGLLELDRGRWDAALEQLRIASGFASPEGNFLVGYTLFLQRRDREAAEYFHKVLGTYGHERKLSAQGVVSEGDVLPTPGKPLNALESAALRSMLLVYWIAERGGGYPASFPKEYRIDPVGAAASATAAPAFSRARALSGGRGAWADFDNDGRVDLIVGGMGRPLALYRNQGGTLVDVTPAANLGGVRDVWDAAWADIDEDGDRDLYLIRSGPLGTGQNLLYRNEGQGKFTDVTATAGLKGVRATARACFADFDGDGRVDLVEAGAQDENNRSLRLYRNTGSGWVERTKEAGLGSRGTAVDCLPGDYDGDGRVDLFVLTWDSAAVLYCNEGNGRFSDATDRAGLSGVGGRSFSALFFDFDKDGRLDLLVSEQAPFPQAVRCLLQPQSRSTRNTPRLFRNAGNGRFSDVTRDVGLDRCYGTIQALAQDFDGDGWRDLLFVNGALNTHRLEPSVILRNVEGREFRPWSYLPSFKSPGPFIGGAAADFNRDGLPDVYLGSNPLFRKKVSSGGVFVNRTVRRAAVSRH
jgi:Tfp pilus assembly protein PilF